MLEHREEQDGTRVYSCKTCNAQFFSRGELKVHSKEHLKIKYLSFAMLLLISFEICLILALQISPYINQYKQSSCYLIDYIQAN